MWRMLQHTEPDDFVLATGETHTIREMAETAAAHLGFDLTWEGAGLEERGIDRKTGKAIIRIDPHYFRPAEVDLLIGDATKAKEKLGWQPRIKFRELITMMAEHDLKEEMVNVRMKEAA